MKMNLQKNENLVHVQQQYVVSFCEKNDSKFGFSQQIWHYQCLIFMILIVTKYLENLLRESSLSQYSIAKIFLFQAIQIILKCLFNNFFWMTPYLNRGRNIGLHALLMQFQDQYKYNYKKQHARERICSPNSIRLVCKRTVIYTMFGIGRNRLHRDGNHQDRSCSDNNQKR